jgi:hypothetical protein
MKKLFIVILIFSIQLIFGKDKSPYQYHSLNSMDSLINSGIKGKNIGLDFKGDSVDLRMAGETKRIKVFYGKTDKSPEGLIIYPSDKSTFSIINSFWLQDYGTDSLQLTGKLQKYRMADHDRIGRNEKVNLAVPVSQIDGVFTFKSFRRGLSSDKLAWGAVAAIVIIVLWQYSQTR